MTRGRWVRWVRIVVVFAVLLATTAPTALGAMGDASSDSGDDSTTVDAVGVPSAGSDAAQREPANNDSSPSDNDSAVAHRNPSEVSDGESAGDVEAWLSREMADRLAESANLSAEDRERARELVGNDSEYAELAEEYGEVANRSGAEGAGQSDEFAAAGQLQREFLADVEQYRQVHESYRDARASNESERTLRLAHELERQSAEVDRTAARLNESYANISAGGQGDLRNATGTIGELRANVTRTQETVRDQTLVRTELSVRASEPDGSFTEPIPLTGQLRTGDGEPIADENVTLRAGNRTLNATTDDEGRFEVEYRPTSVPAGERPRTIAFRPGNESAYLGANASATFGVRQITPNVTISNRTETVRYNETLTVDGTVAAGGVGVPDLPVVVTVDGVRIAHTWTDANGSFGVGRPLPANVSNGSQVVRVQVVPRNASSAALGPGALESESAASDFGSGSDAGPRSNVAPGTDAEPARNVAIAPMNGTGEVTVETTPTSVSITDVRTFNSTAFVAGRLTTEGGEPVPNRTIELRTDGQSVGAATTNATGDFATTVGLPSRLVGGDSTVRLVAAYSPSGGNLAPAEASRTAALGSTGAVVSDRQLQFGAAGLLLVAALGAFVWRFRSSGDGNVPDDHESDSDEEGGPQSGEPSVAGGRSSEVLLNSATAALDDGTLDAAVVAAYAAVRRGFEDGGGSGTPDDGTPAGVVSRGTARTHWEFYADCRDAGVPEERLRRLERLTDTYERATFADESVAEADAREAVADARALRESVGPDAGPLDGGRSEPGEARKESGDAGGSPTD